MGKNRKTWWRTFLLLAMGIFLVAGGFFLRGELVSGALNPKDLVPGERLDEVSNLYLRSMKWDGQKWQAGDMVKLGKYFGGYVVGYRVCYQYADTGGGTYTCQGANQPVTAQGFGMLFQREDKSLAVAIPLDMNYCESDPTCHVPEWATDQVFPWFVFELTSTGPWGHQYGAGKAAGYGVTGVDYPGYVSLEVRLDLENRGPLPGE